MVRIGNGTPEECRHTKVWAIETKAACGPVKAEGLILRRPAALAYGKLDSVHLLYLQTRESLSARFLSAGLVSIRRSRASFRRLRLILFLCIVFPLHRPDVIARAD